MFMYFKTYKKIFSDLGWRCLNGRTTTFAGTTTFVGMVKFVKGELETGWLVGGAPVVGMGVEDRSRKFLRTITFCEPRGEMEMELSEWLSHVEMEYKLFGL